jgi:hypothetical protein
MELRRKRGYDTTNFNTSEVRAMKNGPTELCWLDVVELLEYTAVMPVLFLLGTSQQAQDALVSSVQCKHHCLHI